MALSADTRSGVAIICRLISNPPSSVWLFQRSHDTVAAENLFLLGVVRDVVGHAAPRASVSTIRVRGNACMGFALNRAVKVRLEVTSTSRANTLATNHLSKVQIQRLRYHPHVLTRTYRFSNWKLGSRGAEPMIHCSDPEKNHEANDEND